MIHKSIRFLLFFFFSLIFIDDASGQQIQIDSLKKVILIQEEDTGKVNTLNILSQRLRRTGAYDESVFYSEEAVQLGKKLGFDNGVANAYNSMGIAYEKKGQYEKSLKYHFLSYELKERLQNKIGIGNSLQNIGIVYQLQGNYKLALETLLKCLKLFEEINYDIGIIQSNTNIGIVYEKQKMYGDALLSYEKAVATSERISNPMSKTIAYSNLANAYLYLNNYDESEKYNVLSLSLAETIGDKELIATTTNNLGYVYELQHKYDQALVYYRKAIKIAEEIGNDNQRVGFTLSIGSVLSRLKRFEEARQYLNNGIDLAKHIGYKEKIVEAYLYMSVLDSIENNVSLSLQHFKQYVYHKDSLLNEDNNKQIAQMRAIYETEKKEQEILLLTKEKSLQRVESDKKDLEIKQRLQQILLLDNEKRIKDFQLAEKQGEIERKILFAERKESELKSQTLLTRAREGEVQILNKDKLIQQKEISKQKLVRNGFIGGFAFVLIFAGVFFNQRNRIAKEKDRSEELLLNILPAEVAEELKAKGKADAKDFDLVTILFTDFKEFTQTSERMSAQELVSELNTCFEAFDRIMELHGVEKIKTIGDAYMAAGGLPVPTNDSASNVIKAAIDMRDFMVARKREHEASGKPAFEMRIGIHTGPVVAGIVGVKKFQYDIWGDTVNTASRIESSGEPGKVNISSTTYNMISHKFECEYRGEIEAKGKGKLKMYFVKS